MSTRGEFNDYHGMSAMGLLEAALNQAMESERIALISLERHRNSITEIEKDLPAVRQRIQHFKQALAVLQCEEPVPQVPTNVGIQFQIAADGSASLWRQS